MARRSKIWSYFRKFDASWSTWFRSGMFILFHVCSLFVLFVHCVLYRQIWFCVYSWMTRPPNEKPSSSFFFFFKKYCFYLLFLHHVCFPSFNCCYDVLFSICKNNRKRRQYCTWELFFFVLSNGIRSFVCLCRKWFSFLVQNWVSPNVNGPAFSSWPFSNNRLFAKVFFQ